ncbi:pentatricopeptide repeat-containing protein At5g44230-like isoform X1 [Magnolia sinica]|uniref:pentatricopeptide repeat-containing protein At5g44230-like isoform X1 n=1 Tax=Magnolia sinica TaxID=86752 RepID=UPI00265B506A|nr:pentatricopeptide repeat-containing protein At5g44230-like isoform X1 [Magnolia sinica]XP_058114433.1 pentatricopeptide repeat-containing protein At5g44230-like isoform X1 [Magnolia sinica]XP_058114434.1 pentatricopeptide repeat-containing protein At5g44230-like isoform X1 [Magnolia sinica]
MQLKQIPFQLIARMPLIAETIAEHLQQCMSLESLRQIHAQIISNGLHSENYLAVKLVTCSKELGNIAYARMIFNGLIDSANVFLWTAMITAYSKQQSQITAEAIWIYKMMCQHGIQPNSFTLSSVLKACSFLSAVKEGKQIHVYAAKLGLDSDVYVQTTLMDMYAKFGCIQVATHLFETISEKNVVVCNAMIVCYTKAGNIEAARGIFDKMHHRDSISWTAMLSGYTNRGNMHAAQELFNQMAERDVTSWNAMITGYSHSGDWLMALELFDKMRSENIEPNQVTMAVAISICGQLGALDMARQMHEYLKKTGVEMNVHIFNALIDMYAKCGSVDEAHSVFGQMSVKDTVSYNAMIVGFANHGQGQDALNLFLEFLEGGARPDRITFIGVLTACSHAGLLEVGRQYFDCMTREYAIEPTVDHYACMVDLLGRAGLVEEAYELIKTMAVEPHAGVWGALLSACRTHGNVEIGEIAARELFIIEPENPGNYVLLSNIYARAHMWADVAKVRRWMRGQGVPKTAGCSWIETNSSVHKFLIGDTDHPQCLHIYAMLRHLSLQLASDDFVLDSDFNME